LLDYFAVYREFGFKAKDAKLYAGGVFYAHIDAQFGPVLIEGDGGTFSRA
jgi:hypothetical protein